MPDARVFQLNTGGAAAAAVPATAPAAPAAKPPRDQLRSVADLPDDGSVDAAVSPNPPSDPTAAVSVPDPSTAADPTALDPTASDPTALIPSVPPADGHPTGLLAFLHRRLAGNYPIDQFGFDAELTQSVLLAPLRPLYERYFRVETRGMEHVPDFGGALLVANHSGTVPLDALMTQVALMDHHPAARHLRMLGADLLFRLPVLASLARKGGVTLACTPDAERLLHEGHLVGVWPEGFKGIGKPFSERYKLQRFGRGGFVAAAVRTGVPIIPCSIIGAEEIYPILGNASWLARLLSLPYIPITPTFPWLGALGLVPLPSKWIIEFGEPIETASYGAAAADDPMLIFNLTDEVRETIQSTLYKLLMQRRSVFF